MDQQFCWSGLADLDWAELGSSARKYSVYGSSAPHVYLLDETKEALLMVITRHKKADGNPQGFLGLQMTH